MKKALQFIILLGIVSLFADATYEGARGIVGPFLASLGASSAAVGIIVGLADFVGYAIRGFSGPLSDRTRLYWTFTILGYIINLLSVPILAFIDSWQIAAWLIVIERFGKGLRTPARDSILSYATKQAGRGFGFGLHESLDQIGAVIGPLAMALVLYYKANAFHLAFALLFVPAFLSLLSLFIARTTLSHPEQLSIGK